MDRSLNLQLAAPLAGQPLRVGVLLEGSSLPACWAEVLRDLAAATFVTLRAWTVADASPAAAQEPWPLAAYGRLFARGRDAARDPLTRVPTTPLLANLPAPPLALRDAKVLKATFAELDVLLVLHSGLLDFPALAATMPCELWCFDYGAGPARLDPPPGLREKLAGEPVVDVQLQAWSPGSREPVTVRAARFSTDTDDDPARNREGPLWGSAHLVLRALRAWRRNGHSPRGPEPERDSLPSSPSSVAWFAGQFARKFGRKLRLVPPAPVLHWKMALRRPGEPDSAFRWVESPRGHFWADPFLFEHDGRLWLFFEDLDYATWHGTLWVGEWTDAGLQSPQQVLSRPYHLSYPQVFRDGDDIYMIPETADAGVIELYRARAFPHEWERVRTLVPLKAVDSTVLRHAGQWWLMATAMPVNSHAVTNLLFRADSLLGEWQRVEWEPDFDDVRAARGAGAFYRDGDALCRPSQDCGGVYGRRVLFNRVNRLDAGGYAEHTVATFEPDRFAGCIGVHTWNRAGGWEVIDACFPLPPGEVL